MLDFTVAVLEKSTNGGLNWTEVNIGHTSVLAKNNNGDLYSIYYNTLNLSTDNGENWTSLPQLETNNNYSMDFDENNYIYLCNQYGVNVSTNNGLSWTQKLNLSNPIKILVTPNVLYVLKMFGSTVYYSTNRGSDWNQLESGLENVYTTCFTRNNSGELFCGSENRGIYKANELVISVNSNSNTIPSKIQIL